MPTPSVTIVVPARDAGTTIGVQVAALGRQEYDGDWEVVVVDDGSRDATARVALAAVVGAPVRVLHTQPAGANGARNIGARAGEGDLILFCDADDLVGDGWVRAMVAALEQAPMVGGAVEHTRLNPGISSPTGPGRDRLPGQHAFLPFPLGANCGIRRWLFDQLGGFDEGLGGDEVELFWRGQLAGHALAFAPDAVVHYRHRRGMVTRVRRQFLLAATAPLRYRRLRHLGVTRQLRRAVRSWAWLVLHTGDLLRGRRARDRWVGTAASCLGRLWGSLRHRAWYP